MTMKTLIQNQKINEIARQQVIGVLREILSDPDYGLRLRQEAVHRLKKSVQSKRAGVLNNLDKVLASCRV